MRKKDFIENNSGIRFYYAGKFMVKSEKHHDSFVISIGKLTKKGFEELSAFDAINNGFSRPLFYADKKVAKNIIKNLIYNGNHAVYPGFKTFKGFKP